MADYKHEIVQALVDSGLSGSAGDMTECQAHEVAEVALRVLSPVLAEAVRDRDLLLWLRAEALWIAQYESDNADQWCADLEESEASRQAWAEEAMGADMAIEYETVGTLDDHWSPEPGPNAPCFCLTDEQASRLGPGFTVPVCAVHPARGDT